VKVSNNPKLTALCLKAFSPYLSNKAFKSFDSFKCGKGTSGTGFPKNSHSGSQPDPSNRRSLGLSENVPETDNTHLDDTPDPEWICEAEEQERRVEGGGE
jgi:hypothetical protein